MSMRSVLGVVGGIIGSYFGYPQLGFVVGSLIGGALDPGGKDTQGPRLDDLKVTVSTYGGGIPTVYGTMRVGGNTIWSTDKTEIATTTEQGKGAAPTNTSYRYFVSMMLGLCRTPQIGDPVAVRKVWQDGKLMGDTSAGVSVGSTLATADNPFAALAILPGFEDELPVAQIELLEGIGNVPAYRGLCKAFIFGLETPGGRVPQVSFELCMNAPLGQEVAIFNTIADPAGPGPTVTDLHYAGIIGSQSIEHIPTVLQGGDHSFVSYQIGVDYAHAESSYRTQYGSDLNFENERPLVGSQDQPLSARYYGADDDGNISYFVRDHRSGTETLIDKSPASDGRSAIDFGAYDPVSGRYAFKVTNDTRLLVLPDNAFSPLIASADFAHGICFYNSEVSISYHPTASTELRVKTMSLLSGVWTPVSDISIESPVFASNCLLFRDGTSLYVRLIRDGQILRVDGSTITNLATEAISNDEQTFFANDQYAIVGPYKSGGISTYKMVRYAVPQPALANVADIITDQCERAGLTADQIDVSSIDDTVWGYTITNPASARTNIQPLMTAFAIDATEEDGKIKFFKRADQVSVATIAYDELACAEDGADPGDPMPLTRGQEAELPRSVAVSYPNPAFDYQTCTEKAIRQVTTSQLDQVIELPIAMTGTQAASIAQTILYDAWNERDKRSFSVSRKYGYLNAGDVATIENPRGTFKQYRITKLTDTGATMQGECVNFDSGIYTQTVVGSGGGTGQVVEPLAPPTEMTIVDSSIMRDADNDAGPYVALGGYAANYPGGELFVDDISKGTVASEAVQGFAETTLGAWSRHVVDETNLVTVNVGHHELSNMTRALLFTGTQNVAAIGANGRWEVIVFQRADDLGSGRYILSGLRRGVRGTEHNRGNHASGDRFVMMSTAGMLRPATAVGEIGLTKTYEAVTKGRSMSSATPVDYANTGEGLKPFSPQNLRKSVASNNITLTWDRRTRVSENFWLGTFPLGENTEHYQVAIYSDNTFATVKRVIDAYSRTVTYLSPDQIADFGANQTTLYVRVFQMSDSVNRGHELEATI